MIHTCFTQLQTVSALHFSRKSDPTSGILLRPGMCNPSFRFLKTLRSEWKGTASAKEMAQFALPNSLALVGLGRQLSIKNKCLCACLTYSAPQKPNIYSFLKRSYFFYKTKHKRRPMHGSAARYTVRLYEFRLSCNMLLLGSLF